MFDSADSFIGVIKTSTAVSLVSEVATAVAGTEIVYCQAVCGCCCCCCWTDWAPATDPVVSFVESMPLALRCLFFGRAAHLSRTRVPCIMNCFNNWSINTDGALSEIRACVSPTCFKLLGRGALAFR